MKKRLLSMILVLCMLLTLMPTVTFADTNTYTSGNLTYAYDDSLNLTVDGSGTVTRADVTKATGNSLIINTLTIGKDVTLIATDAFGDFHLSNVIILGKTWIEENAFRQNPSLESVYLYDCEYVDRNAFPDSLSYTLYYYTTNQAAAEFDNAPNKVALNGSCGATESDNVTWKLSSDGTMTIGGTGAMADYSVTRFAGGSLEDDRPWKALVGMIKKSVIADGVTKVGNNAFARCANLTSVTISTSVNTIGENAFNNCKGLNSVVILGSVNIIGKYAFFDCKVLNSVVILGSVNTIDLCAFYCRSTVRKLNMYIMGSIQSIGLLAFSMTDEEGNDIPFSNFKIYKYDDSVEQAFKAAGYTTFTYSQSCFVITGGKWGMDYDYDLANGVLTVLTSTPLTIENVDKDTATSHRIVVKKDMDANITLAGVNIENSSASPFEIEKDSEGDVTITLADGTTNTLKATNYSYYAALQKEGDGAEIGKLTIQGGTLGTGELIAEAQGGAGIGSGTRIVGSSGNVSNITITGGCVTTNSTDGAGIGSGYAYGNSGLISNITITGGCVTATSEVGAGIGSGYAYGNSGSISNITITGGCVTATSVGSAAVDEIAGGGTKGTVSNIVITGGSVKASSLGCTPTDGEGNNVYLLIIDTSTGDTISANGKDYPAWHEFYYYSGSGCDAWGADPEIYVYLPDAVHSVTVGNETNLWHFNSSTKTFVKTDCYDNNGDCLCDLCGETCHHIVSHSAQDATCTEVGWYDYVSCSQCDYTTYREIPATDHDWGEWSSNGNGTHSRVCGNDAKHVETEKCSGGMSDCTHKAVCTVCGEEYGEVDGTNHDFSKRVKSVDTLKSAATCQDEAVYYYTCSRCGEIEKSDTHTFEGELDSSKHTDTKEWSTKNATQHEQTWKCCGVVEIALEDHEWKDGVCEECGYVCLHTGGMADCAHKAICEICGDEYGEVDGNNHTGGTEVKNASAATCTEDGHTGDTHCLGCGEKLADGQAIPAAGHTDTDKDHICDVKSCGATVGEHEATEGKHTCDYCGQAVTECADENDDHLCDICGATLTAHTGGVASCTEKAICEICGAEYGEFDPDDHSDLNHVEEKAATTESEGNIEYWYCGDCERYFADEACTMEITLADTVIGKLEPPAPPATDIPKTDDATDVAMWLTMLLLSTAALGVLYLNSQKKRA